MDWRWKEPGHQQPRYWLIILEYWSICHNRFIYLGLIYVHWWTGSTLFQVMACWLFVPSHYLNQYQLEFLKQILMTIVYKFEIAMSKIHQLFCSGLNGLNKLMKYMATVKQHLGKDTRWYDEKTWKNTWYCFILRLIIPHLIQSLTIQNITTVEILYSTIYYSKYFIELNFDKSTQYVALWTHKRHPIPRPFGRAMECLLWVLQQKLTVL